MSKTNCAVYPGSFDPPTLGHIDIIRRAAKIFDELIVLVAESSRKAALFTPERRKSLIEESLGPVSNVKVVIHDGLTVDFVKKMKAKAIIRGLRAVSDFEYELAMATMNRKLAPDVETLIIMTDEKFHYIASHTVKEVALHGGDVSQLVPGPVVKALGELAKGSKK
ncbi:MAG: pantetheine-phosphate adenylyltransferase [Oligoflexia bacterium]|nr:pantetheine-phosphate adenylyltransferase [Oligoflexia bacterium]